MFSWVHTVAKAIAYIIGWCVMAAIASDTSHDAEDRDVHDF